MNGREQIGLVVCTSIDEYLNNTIKNTNLQELIKNRIELTMLTIVMPIQVLFSLHIKIRKLLTRLYQRK